jgi:hypothetical protein
VSDLLSAASLLLTIVAVIYAVWYPAIIGALDIVPEQHSEDNAGNYRRVRDIQRSKAVPLMVVTVLLTFIFIPDAVAITLSSAARYRELGVSALRHYSAVTTSFVLVTCLLGVLAIHLIHLNCQLRALLKKLK